MAKVNDDKESAPQIGTPVGSLAELETLGVPTRNIASCSMHALGNMGCPVFDICDRDFRGSRPRMEIVRRISGQTGDVRTYHAPCFATVPREHTASDNGDLYDVIGGEGDVYEARGSVKLHPKRDPNCNACSEGKCESWVDRDDIPVTCPEFPAAADHVELKRYGRKAQARRGSAVKAKDAVRARLLGSDEPVETIKVDEPKAKGHARA